MIVSDVSPLLSLSRVGRLELLRILHGTAAVPPAVHREVVTEGKRRGAPDGGAPGPGGSRIHRPRRGAPGTPPHGRPGRRRGRASPRRGHLVVLEAVVGGKLRRDEGRRIVEDLVATGHHIAPGVLVELMRELSG